MFRVRALVPFCSLLFAFLVTCVVAAPATAWSESGHRLIDAVAWRHMEPATRAESLRLLETLADVEPSSPSFVEAGTWLDELRDGGLRIFDTWHFVNRPLDPDGLGVAPEMQSGDLRLALDEGIRVLGDPNTPEFARAFMLRVLIHAVGDAHQPLHCVARITKEHPLGDRGGNDFPVDSGDPDAANLHRLWDQGFGHFEPAPSPADAPADPASEHERDLVRWASAVDALLAHSGPTDRDEPIDLGSLEPGDWIDESFELAPRLYEDIEPGDRPSDDYLARGRELTGERVLLAGLRLAELLDRLLAPGGD